MKKKKLIISAIAALAGGGLLYVVYKRKQQEEEEKESSKIVSVQPPSDTDVISDTTDGGDVEDDVFGGGGSGGGGGGGTGANQTLCRGLDEEGNVVTALVPNGEECPEYAPFSDDTEWDEFSADAFRCYALDENNEVIEMEKEFTEVCGEDYPDYPFETYNEAVLYASDPEMYEGCTDPAAFNFNEEAILDDGSCEPVVEGCKILGAENYDEEANTENNDLCEFPPDAILGCTNEEAINFNADAETDDGSCIMSVECFYITDAPYSVASQTFELAENQTCESGLEPTYLDLQYEQGGEDLVISNFMQSGYFNAYENAAALLTGMGDQANSLGGDPTEVIECYLIDAEGTSVFANDFSVEQGGSCEDVDFAMPLYDTEEEAQEALDELNALDTQECYTYDSQGVYILEDLPLLDEDNNVIPCEDLGYFSLSIGGQNEAQDAYDAEFPTTDFESNGEVDTSAIITPECGSLDYCTQGGNVPADLLLNFASFYGTITANEVNEMLGFECYDPTTCMNIYAPPPLQEGEIATTTDAQGLVLGCLPQNDPDFPALITGVSNLSYPLWWEDFNDYIGFDCLNEFALPVNPSSANPNEDLTEDVNVEDDDSLLGDSNDTEEPLVDLDFEGGEEEEATEDTNGETPQEIFSNFVNSRKKLSQKGCTDPIALNFDEGAEVDDGSCQY